MNINTEFNVGEQTKPARKAPDYYYRRHMGSFKVYRDNHNGTSDKLSQHWDEEEARKEVYRLNGWTYKPKVTRHE